MVGCWGRSWIKKKLMFRRNGCNIVCSLIKLWFQWKILPFNPMYFSHTTHRWHRALNSPGSQHFPCSSTGSLLHPWGRLVLRVAQVFSAHPSSSSHLETHCERRLVKGALDKDGGCFWFGEMNRQGFFQHLSISQIEHTDEWPALETSTVIYSNTVIFPLCCLREAGPRWYLLNNYPFSQGQRSLQLLHRGAGGHLWRLLRSCALPPGADRAHRNCFVSCPHLREGQLY